MLRFGIYQIQSYNLKMMTSNVIKQFRVNNIISLQYCYSLSHPSSSIFLYFIDYAFTVLPFFPFVSLHPVPLFPSAILPLSSCPWVVHVNSLASSFPILFLISPCLFCSYKVCFFFFFKTYLF